MNKIDTPSSNPSATAISELTDKELDGIAGGDYSTLFRFAALGVTVGAHMAAGSSPAFINTNCFLCPN